MIGLSSPPAAKLIINATDDMTPAIDNPENKDMMQDSGNCPASPVEDACNTDAPTEDIKLDKTYNAKFKLF